MTLRPIDPDDKGALAAAFERLSEESRYRRFFAPVPKLTPAMLTYLTDVDHHDHEAIIAVDPATGDLLGVARYVRAGEEPDVAEVAVTVIDDWQGRGLGRVLLERIAARARQEGVRHFSAVAQAENIEVVGLLKDLGETVRSREGSEVTLLIDLPSRGIGVRLARVLRGAAEGSLIVADTVAHRVAASARRPARPPVGPPRPIHTIVVGTDGSPAGGQAVREAVELAGHLGADVHVVSAYWLSSGQKEAEAIVARAQRAARASGQRLLTHALHADPAEALIAVAEEQDADLIVVGAKGVGAAVRFLLGSVADRVSRHAPCSVLIVHTN